jgi:hypothetical protein
LLKSQAEGLNLDSIGSLLRLAQLNKDTAESVQLFELALRYSKDYPGLYEQSVRTEYISFLKRVGRETEAASAETALEQVRNKYKSDVETASSALASQCDSL